MANTESTWRDKLADGVVIPALPLPLFEEGKWSPRHQQAIVRYYVEAGAGGIAAGVHSTQFEIRQPQHALFEPVLQLTAEVLDRYAAHDFVRIAGICGDTKQALAEACLAAKIGYHAGLLSLSAFNGEPEAAAIEHAKQVASVLPIVGFYLQPAVGGCVLSYQFWREFCEIENVVAVKIAPFNRYQTWDVIRAVIDSGRGEICLYTGNDDSIIVDLLTPFAWQGTTRFIQGGLLGQWGVWTRQAAKTLAEIKVARASDAINPAWLTRNAALTDANAALFDAANNFAGCIPGIMEVLRRQGLAPSNRCLNVEEKLSPGQMEEIDRVCKAYPELTDDKFVRTNLNRWLGE